MDASPRGLAAAVMAHVDPGSVSSVSGSAFGAGLMTDLELTGSDATGVFVDVTEAIVAHGACGGDDGFRQVDCVEGAKYSEVVVKKRPGPRTPIYLGRALTADRGSVLVEVFGTASHESLALVRALVADPLVGLRTTAALNDRGEQIENFGESDMELTVDSAR